MRTALYATFFLLLVSLFELGLAVVWAGPNMDPPAALEQILNGLPEEQNETFPEKDSNTEYLRPPANWAGQTCSPPTRDEFFNRSGLRVTLRFQPVWVPPPRTLPTG